MHVYARRHLHGHADGHRQQGRHAPRSPRRSRSPPRPVRPTRTARRSSPTAREFFWRFGESSGNTADRRRAAPSTRARTSTATRSGSRARCPSPNTAVQLQRQQRVRCPPTTSYDNPTVYSEEAWFKTTTTVAARSSASAANRTGSSNSYDRHVYMQDDGQLVFGTYTGQLNTITTAAAYNNGQWHHVVATQSRHGHEALRRRPARRHQPADRRPRATPATGRSAATSPGARPAPTSTAPSTRSRCT